MGQNTYTMLREIGFGFIAKPYKTINKVALFYVCVFMSGQDTFLMY